MGRPPPSSALRGVWRQRVTVSSSSTWTPRLTPPLASGSIPSHSYVRGGDYPDLANPRTGLLGADLEEVDGFYRIARIYSGEGWTPGLTGPLSVPGMDVGEGDYLLAIDGRDVGAGVNPYRLLEGSSGRTITLTVASDASGSDVRDIFVRPIGSDPRRSPGRRTRDRVGGLRASRGGARARAVATASRAPGTRRPPYVIRWPAAAKRNPCPTRSGVWTA